MAPKLDSLWKHVGRKRAKKDMSEGKELKVKCGDVFLKDTPHPAAHVHNKVEYVERNGRKDDI